jgi:parallel beta-helix repeat protein
MKPLDQIEPRTAIWQPAPGGFPIVINAPGSYYVGENITGVAGKDGIHIRASNVTLDLNGFTVQGVPGSFNGITVPIEASPVYNITIYNGTIREWGNAGIAASSPNGNALNSQLRDLKVYNNGAAGVRVEEALVTGVLARANLSDGIKVSSGQVVDSMATGNGRDGISLWEGEIRGCVAASNSNDGIEVQQRSLVVGNVARDNGVDMATGGHGINVTGVNNRIEGNSAAGNGLLTGALGDGIHVTGESNRIEGNDVQLNKDAGIDSSVGSGGNLIIKNSAGGNLAGDYVLHGSDTIGQAIVGGAGPFNSDQPWANFHY